MFDFSSFSLLFLYKFFPNNLYQEPSLIYEGRMMAGNEVKVRIEKFDGTNFGYWRMQTEDYLYQKRL